MAEGDLVLAAAATVLGVWSRSAQWVAVATGVALIVRRRVLVAVLCVVLGLVGAWQSASTWTGAHPRHLGDFAGWVTVAGDPIPQGSALRVTLEVEGERFDTWAYGSARRRLADRQVGERVYVEGERRPITTRPRRAQVRHVVGRIELHAVGDWHDGSRLSTTSSRVRVALRRAAERVMVGDDASLFTGLVIGDDSRQSPRMIQEFRASGLSHLTAVSGENVAFIVAAASPVLRRMRPGWRWATTLALICWFMMLTRFEPSVMRAGVMAIVATTGYVAGRDVSALRALACTVIVLALIDPMLVWSVGFWLSTGATAGVCLAGPRLADALPGPQWLRLPVSVTLGAQIGVAVPSWLVFHRLPLVSLPANLLAVPVAGFVMLCGLPCGLVAAAVPGLAPVVMAPCVLATRWVASVGFVFAAVEPPPAYAAAGWAVIAAGVVVRVVRHRWRRAVGRVPI